VDVSVVIPTYNNPTRLLECLDGLAAQEAVGARVEVVVVDDGSTDDTAEHVAAAQAGFPYPLRCVRKPNGGVSSARNAGIREARGATIAFLDHDCIPRPDWLRQVVRALAEHPEASGVGGVIEPTGTESRISRYIDARKLLSEPTVEDGRVTFVITANSAFRKRALEEIGGFDERFPLGGEDVDLSRRLLEAGKTLAREDAMVVRHHHRTRLRPFVKTFYWYGYGSGMARFKLRGEGSGVEVLRRRAWSVAYLAFAPVYAAGHLARGIGVADAMTYGALDALRKAAYALGKARGLAAGMQGGVPARGWAR
jgi:GT2 family glycosyltransferase